MAVVPITVPGVGESITEGILAALAEARRVRREGGRAALRAGDRQGEQRRPRLGLGGPARSPSPRARRSPSARSSARSTPTAQARPPPPRRRPPARPRREPAARPPGGRGRPRRAAPADRADGGDAPASRPPSAGWSPRRASTPPRSTGRAAAAGSPRRTCWPTWRRPPRRPRPRARNPPRRRPPLAPAAARPRETRKRMSGIRQQIAERLVEAQQTAAILTTFNEADLSRVMDLRARYKDDVQEEARRRPRLHVVLRQGERRGPEGLPGGQRPDRRRRHRPATTSTTSASPSAPSTG